MPNPAAHAGRRQQARHNPPPKICVETLRHDTEQILRPPPPRQPGLGVPCKPSASAFRATTDPAGATFGWCSQCLYRHWRVAHVGPRPPFPRIRLVGQASGRAMTTDVLPRWRPAPLADLGRRPCTPGAGHQVPDSRRGTPARDDDTTQCRPARQARQALVAGGAPRGCEGAPSVFGAHAHRYMPARQSIRSPLRNLMCRHERPGASRHVTRRPGMRTSQHVCRAAWSQGTRTLRCAARKSRSAAGSLNAGGLGGLRPPRGNASAAATISGPATTARRRPGRAHGRHETRPRRRRT